jgi:hypothetical protein
MLNQFPMKLVQKSFIVSKLGALAAVLIAACGVTASSAAEPQPYAEHFDPAKGFKPAQRSFQPIFLQMAGSLEHYGTPANYLRHVAKETKRVEAAWLKAKGKPATFRPAYFTDEYIEKLITGWNHMAPVLALESFSWNSGRHVRFAMLGSWNATPAELAALETKLTPKEAAEYQRFVGKPFFKKPDLAALEKFYEDGNGYDKLSYSAKEEMSKRIERGIMPPNERDADIKSWEGGTMILAILREHQEKSLAGIEGKAKPVNADDLRDSLIQALKLRDENVATEKMRSVQRDAFVYSHTIKANLNRRLTEISKQASPQQMKDINVAINLMLENLLVAAQLEYEAGLWDQFLNR